MRTALLMLALLALSTPLLAEATAYQAFRYLAERRGEESLNNVYLVRGIGGRPQPAEWILYRGRADATVLQVTGVEASGRITTGRAAVREQGLPPDALPLNFSVLNLDTHAAWNIARRHARRENFAFDCADYQLTTHPLAQVPAWTMILFNEERGMLGTITLSGATGEVLNQLKLYSFCFSLETRELIMIREPWGHRAARSVGRWFSRSGEACGHDFLNAAGTTEEILLKRRTRHFSEDAR